MEEEEAPEEGDVETPYPAETYAAEALAADMDPWIVFDSRRTPKCEFDDWLESNMPSQVRRYGNKGRATVVGWISVQGPHYCPDSGDVEGLQESWENLLASSRPVSFQTIKELALNHQVLSGKWLMHLDTGFKLDRAWECVARATLDGKIFSTKVSPFDPTAGDERQVICVHNTNFTDEREVVELDSVIRATGVKCPLYYKPDAYTYLGIYRKNRWNLCPTIYESKFDLERVPRRSHITNKVTNLEVT